MISSLTRRDAIKKTVLFSTAMLTPGWLRRLRAENVPTTSGEGLHLLALGDFGMKNETQRLVAARLAAYARGLGRVPDAVFALGDNFYGRFTRDRFQKHFEEMYAADALNCPFYVCMGNHDYERVSYGIAPEPLKCDVQLKYSLLNPRSRWKAPAKWYALELPSSDAPLVRVIVLDSNFNVGDLTANERLEQDRFLRAELARKTRAPWSWIVAHHPVFSQSVKRGDSKGLLSRWGEILQTNPISLYLSGHDHTMQHIEAEGFQPSFVVSGGGGAGLHEVVAAERAFAQALLGFHHIHVTRDLMAVHFIGVEGQRFYSFTRDRTGIVTVVS